MAKPSSPEYNYAELLAAVADPTVAAIRLTIDMSPMGGDGARVFPPTYMGAEYAASEHADGDGKTVVLEDVDGSNRMRLRGGDEGKMVVLDSVQSQANRLEDALQAACDGGDLSLPLLTVDFGDLPREPKKLTALQMPHRWADAILRDSVEVKAGGKPFPQSKIGKALADSNLRDSTAVFGYCPSSLLFGVWHSTGAGGGKGAKYPRALVSEIVAYGAREAKQGMTRIDPAGIEKESFVNLEKGKNRVFLEWVKSKKPNAKSAPPPSEINHGNIPVAVGLGGVTFRAAKLTAVITLAGLRRLRFPVDGGLDKTRDDAARAVLAAMGLFALARQNEIGYALRSRCDLEAGAPRFEFVRNGGADNAQFALDSQSALEALRRAIDEAKKRGLPWRDEKGGLVFKPEPGFEEVIKEQAKIDRDGSGD